MYFIEKVYLFLLLPMYVYSYCFSMYFYFLGCKANTRAQLAKTGHGPHSSNCCVILCIVCFISFYVLFVCKCVLLPPGDNSIAVNKYIISYIISGVALCRWGYRWWRLREGCVFNSRVNDTVIRIVKSQKNWIQSVFVSKSAPYIQAPPRQ